ncbi:MAG: hypothetical protein ACR2HR_13955 [Euzebya sp.]
MSSPPGKSPRLDEGIEEHPLRGGLVGIGLVALATVGLAAVGAIICLLALLLIG